MDPRPAWHDLLTWLEDGDLRTDGAANEVAALVQRNPELVPDLLKGLGASQAEVRGHAADALEKVARSEPQHFRHYVPELIRAGLDDGVPMVRWHIAMILGHLSLYEDEIPSLYEALLELLRDQSAFVRSWAIASLCIIARGSPERCEGVIQSIGLMAGDRSVAIRSRVRKALACLVDPDAPLPAGWVKSYRVREWLDTARTPTV